MTSARYVAAVVSVFALCGCSPTAAQAVPGPVAPPTVTLQLPTGGGGDDALEVLVTLGPIPAGSRVLVRMDSGALVGVIAPFGPRANATGGTYAVPLHPSAFQRGAVTLRLELEEADGQTVRPPLSTEVTHVTVVRTP